MTSFRHGPRQLRARPKQPLRTYPHIDILETRTLPSGNSPVGAALPPLTVDTVSYMPSDILVRYRSEAAMHGARVVTNTILDREISVVPGLHKVRLGAGTSVAAALAAYRAIPQVLYAEPDYRIHLTQTPNDPRYVSQWDLNNTGQTAGKADADIDASEAWSTTTGSGSTIVAVIDTGVDWSHPDLAANIWTNSREIAGNGIDDDGDGFVDDVHGYDFVNRDGNPMDDHGHGTHVAGTIGAVGNNGIGTTGINWHVQIMALKILDAQGSGNLSDAIAALNFAVAHGATISNNSYGGDPFTQAFSDAIKSAGNAGHIFVTAAGNGNFLGIGQNNDKKPFYPASYNLPNIIAVAATDANDNLATFSNYGATSVDLAAPGVGILSTLPNNSYGVLDGTSMATPHVTGVIALVRDLHPNWSSAQVINQVLGTVDALPSLKGKMVTGGRLNAARAVQGAAVTDLAWPAGAIAGPATADSKTPVTINRTYTVSGTAAKGNFLISYYASTDAILGNGDDIPLGSETISAAADKCVGNHAGSSPGLLIPSGGTFYLFARLDGGNDVFETNETNNVAKSAQQVVVSGPMILDNGQPGYTETGSGWVSYAAGYNGNLRFHAAASGADTASWQASGLLPGYYTIQATWNASSNHASNAPYAIYDGTTLLRTVVVDQRPAPAAGTTVNGVVFQDLASVPIASGTLRVVLADNVNGYVVADAVRLVPIPTPVVDLNWSSGGISGPVSAPAQTPFTLTRNYTVNNTNASSDFAIAYYASTDAVLGNADDILLGTETISAAADKAVGSHSGTSPSFVIAVGGTFNIFATVDIANAVVETNESNNTAQTPQPVVVSGPVLVDNGQPGYTETGSGWTSYAAGYNGDLRFHAAASGADTASWQASGLPAGYYVIQATWNASSNHPSNAPFAIYDGATLIRTVIVDQRPAPVGITIGGVVFQDLTSVHITTGTIRVVVSDNTDGYVVADAVRFALIPTPAVDLNWSGGGVSGPATASSQAPFALSRGYTISGAPVVSNFTIAYYASTDGVFGNADDILLGTETISAAADKAIGNHMGATQNFSIATGGTYNLFANVDTGDAVLEGDETNNLAQAAQPVAVTVPLIVDDGQAGYSESGAGWTSYPVGYNGGVRYNAPGSGANTASWQVTGLSAGYFTVQATWNASSNHPSNAPYAIYDGTTLLLTVVVDQRPAPTGTTIGGVIFQDLATVNITTGTLRVVLSDNANGYVVADAVRVVPIPAVVVSGPLLLDNGQPGYSESGAGWVDYAAGYSAGLRFRAPGGGTNPASWQASGLPVGFYTVQATWNASSNHASNATYSIYDGNALIDTVVVDQRPAPSGVTVGNVDFQDLANVFVFTGTLRVVLSDNTDGYVVADAVRLVLMPPLTDSSIVAPAPEPAVDSGPAPSTDTPPTSQQSGAPAPLHGQCSMANGQFTAPWRTGQWPFFIYQLPSPEHDHGPHHYKLFWLEAGRTHSTDSDHDWHFDLTPFRDSPQAGHSLRTALNALDLAFTEWEHRGF